VGVRLGGWVGSRLIFKCYLGDVKIQPGNIKSQPITSLVLKYIAFYHMARDAVWTNGVA